jgi:hypothetical protein
MAEYRKAEGYHLSFIASGVTHRVSNEWRTFMECDCKRRTQEGASTILELQEALSSGRLGDGELSGVTDIPALMGLKARLERVKSWGGQYSQVEFSENVKEILGEVNNPLRHEYVAS